MSLKQWIDADPACLPKSSQPLATQPTISVSTLPATPSAAPRPDSLPKETLSEHACSLDDGTALVLQEFRLSCLD